MTTPSDYQEPLVSALTSQTPTLFGVPHMYFLWHFIGAAGLFMSGFWMLLALLVPTYLWGVYQTRRDADEMLGKVDQSVRAVLRIRRYDP